MAPAPATIRPATAADLPAVAAIYDDAVATGTASFELAPPGEAEMARRMQALLDGSFPYLVAERQGAVLGYAYAGPHHTRPGYRWTVDSSIYVAQTARGTGLGGLLLGALVAEAEAKGFRQMVAVIGGAGNAASVAVHARHGFVHVGTLEGVGRKHGRWLDVVLMQRRLGPGDTAPPAGET